MILKFLRKKDESPSKTGSSGSRTCTALASKVAVLCGGLLLSGVAHADTSLFNLSAGNFTQNWSDTGQITVNDNYSGVSSITGFRGDGLSNAPGTNPQTVTADGTTTPINVLANQTGSTTATTPDGITSGTIAEFEIIDPVVGFQGSGTADAPHLNIYLNSTGRQNVTVSYRLRDLESGANNAAQAVALQFRVGGAGPYTDVPAAFVADATTGPNTAGPDINVSAVLPAGANNQANLQVRIITNDAVGSDEFVGVDDIVVSSVVNDGTTPTATPGPTPTATPIPTSTPVPTPTTAPAPTPTPGPGAPVSSLVINEIYGGGGTTGATLNRDYVELFNAGTTAVDLSGFSIQYASATNNFSSVAPLTGTIQPGGYFLIGLGPTSTTVGSPLPAQDVNGSTNVNLSGTTGKVALVFGTTLLSAFKTPSAPGVIDFVGYGTADSFETAVAPAPSVTTSIARATTGVDTNNNSTDFIVLTTPDPDNSATAGSVPAGVAPSSATAFAVSGTSLFRFNTATPGAITLVGDTGLTFAGIDFNPADGRLFGLVIGDTTTSLYTLNLTTGAPTLIGSFASAGTMGANSYNLVGQSIGFDFNPKTLQVTDGSIRIRVTAQNGSDLRLNSATGAIAAVDPTLNGAATSSVGSAYTNNIAQSSGATTLYNVSDSTDTLYIQNPANAGTLMTVGALGIDIKATTGFDILTGGNSNVAFLATDANNAGGSEFFIVDLRSGTASAAGNFGSVLVSGIAVVPNVAVAASSNALINEFRTSGPSGVLDEFIEIYNQTNVPLDLAGWTLVSNGVTVGIIPTGKAIPPYGRLLLTGSTYSLATYGGTGGASDVALTGDVVPTGTLELRNSGGTVVDTVTPSTLAAPTSATSNYSYVRRMDGPGGAATLGSAFNTVDVNSTSGPGTSSGTSDNLLRLGAPGPQNLSSPTVANNLITFVSTGAPTRTGSGDTGTLAFRNTITNRAGSGRTLTALRFRLVAVTAGTTPTGTSDIRLASSSAGGTVLPLILETPPAQPLGGGLNTSGTVSLSSLPGGGLAPGQSVTVEFLFTIFQRGAFRYLVNLEPVTSP